MVDADLAAGIERRAARFEDVEVGERESMMLVVVSKERQRRIFIHDFGFEHVAIPGDHLLISPRHVDDVGELDRLDHCLCLPLIPGRRTTPDAAPNHPRKPGLLAC
jgi:hypothetical protein